MSLATRGLLELAPRKAAISTKYAAGAVLVIGGAAGMTGAPQLAGLAAMRSGAGLAWLAVPEPFAAAAELMVRPLPEGLELAERADAVVLGPGLGRADEAGDLARRLARRHRGPMVIDADALFALSGRLELTARRRMPAVLTPHEGELGRLLERDSGWVRANRMEAVRSAASLSKAVVLLKGPDTLVAAPGGDRVIVSTSEAHGLATAGSGDVLSGVIGALLARRPRPAGRGGGRSCRTRPRRPPGARARGARRYHCRRRDPRPTKGVCRPMSDQTTPTEPTVSQMMRTDVPTIPPTMEIGDLARLLSDERMSSVAVVDDGKLVGMVGQSDLIFQEIEDDVEMPHTIPILGGVIFLERMDHWREKFRKAFGVTAADLMTSDPISVAPGDSVHEAASEMIKHDVNRLPVVDDAGAVVGVISRADVVRALAEEW